MIQSDFSSMIASESVRFSGSQFCFVVEALAMPLENWPLARARENVSKTTSRALLPIG
jgi:hypothetical protein